MARGAQAVTHSVTLATGSLKAALKTVVAAVEARNTIPILSNVLLRVTAEHLTVTATDLDVEITRQVPVGQSAGSWGTTVPGRVLASAVDKLPKEAEVMLTQEDGRLRMACGRARFVLPTLPVDDFPFIACGDWAAQWEMSGGDLSEALAHARPAMSSEEARYYLNGVLFQRQEAELWIVATDGHRLHAVHLPAPDGSEPLADSIVPRKAVPIIQTLCAEARVDVAFAPGKMRLCAGETTLVSKLIDGSFPDWRRVVPQSTDKRCDFGPRALEDALGRVAAIHTGKERAVKLDIGGDAIELTVTCPDAGMATEEVEASNDGEATIGFNARFLADVLAQLPGEDAVLAFTDGTGPTKWSKPDGGDRFCVLMPMRV